MRSFELFVTEKNMSSHVRTDMNETPLLLKTCDESPFSAVTESELATPPTWLKLFVHGADATVFSTAISGNKVRFFLRDLSRSVWQLCHVASSKKIISLHDSLWEFCLERIGDHALLSLYRTGPNPIIALYNKCVYFADVYASVLETCQKEAEKKDALAPEFATLSLHLSQIKLETFSLDLPSSSKVTLKADKEALVSFSGELLLRDTGLSPSPKSDVGKVMVEQLDLHALLFRGQINVEIRGRKVSFGDEANCFPFLIGEELFSLGANILSHWEKGNSLQLQQEFYGVKVGVRLNTEGELSLSLSPQSEPGLIQTFPMLSVVDIVDACIRYGRALVRAILHRDRNQAKNIRFSAFRNQLKKLDGALRLVCSMESEINHSPESYRVYAENLKKTERSPLSTYCVQYTKLFKMSVPAIDLRSTFLLGDKLVVGSLHFMFGIDKHTGHLLWKVPIDRATSVPTPLGLARLSPEGDLTVYNTQNGDVIVRTKIMARKNGRTAGAVVHSPGLPKLLIVTEGEHHLVGVDLLSGEPRWRSSWGKSSNIKMKRHGRLLYLTSEEYSLTALDVVTGDMVWRAHSRLRFRLAPVVDFSSSDTSQHSVFVVAGGKGGKSVLISLDPYSGAEQWSSTISEGSCFVDDAPMVTERVVVAFVRQSKGMRMIAFCKRTGELLWDTEKAIAHQKTSWISVDQKMVGNTPSGSLIALDDSSGKLCYKHEFGKILETDLPRHLQPCLRGGALFVPYKDVHVIRPSDGFLMGKVNMEEAIPDFMKVDEKGTLFAAEESGYFVSYSPLPNLSVVKNQRVDDRRL